MRCGVGGGGVLVMAARLYKINCYIRWSSGGGGGCIPNTVLPDM